MVVVGGGLASAVPVTTTMSDGGDVQGREPAGAGRAWPFRRGAVGACKAPDRVTADDQHADDDGEDHGHVRGRGGRKARWAPWTAASRRARPAGRRGTARRPPVRANWVTTTSWRKAPGARTKNGPHTTARLPAAPARKGTEAPPGGRGEPGQPRPRRKGGARRPCTSRPGRSKRPPTARRAGAPAQPVPLEDGRQAEQAERGTERLEHYRALVDEAERVHGHGPAGDGHGEGAAVRTVQPRATTPIVSTSGTARRAAAKAVRGAHRAGP